MPRADVACGKVFFPDRRTAEGHRIGLELWKQATGRTREGYRLAVYRCGRCGGFHLATRKIEPKVVQEEPASPDSDTAKPWEEADPTFDVARTLTDDDLEVISQPW